MTTFASLLLATDWFFSEWFERARKTPPLDGGVEGAVTDHLRGLSDIANKPGQVGADAEAAAKAVTIDTEDVPDEIPAEDEGVAGAGSDVQVADAEPEAPAVHVERRLSYANVVAFGRSARLSRAWSPWPFRDPNPATARSSRQKPGNPRKHKGQPSPRRSSRDGWSVAGFGDFDADGAVDLLWTAEDGALAYSTLDAADTGLVALGVLEADESVVAVGDLDGDGAGDLVVKAGDGSHAAWTFEPEGVAIQTLDQPDAASSLAASGDFDGDATTDLLWQAADGSLHADFFAGGEVDAILVVSNGGDTVLGAGDFTGDGVDDVLIRDASGRLGVLAMGDRAQSAALSGPVDAGSDWNVESVGDYDGNGVADVLWTRGDSLVLRLDGDPVDLPIDAGSDWMLIPAGL